MHLSETGFTFNGKHSYRDMGCLWVEDGHEIIPSFDYNELEIARRDGTMVLASGTRREKMKHSGTLYLLNEPRSQAEAQQMIRRISTWLGCGQQQLIYDYEPDKYYLAMIAGGSTWSIEHWFGGEIPVTFELQPLAYNTQETRVTASETKATLDIPFTMHTGVDAPLSISITNTGKAITFLTVYVNDEQVLTVSSLAVGKTLQMDSDVPCGVYMNNDLATGMAITTGFKPALVHDGENRITIACTSSGPGISATITARGRY